MGNVLQKEQDKHAIDFTISDFEQEQKLKIYLYRIISGMVDI